MTAQRLVMIHTVPALADTFAGLAEERLDTPADLVHVVDETLLADAIAQDGLSPPSRGAWPRASSRPRTAAPTRSS
jgi:hypothetical protein